MSPFTESEISRMSDSPTSTAQHPPYAQWKIDDAPGSLPTIPPCYPMAQTSVLLPETDEAEASSATYSPSKVAGRIATCLRDRSIYAAYDAENATAFGTNVDHVELCIRLFHAPPVVISSAATAEGEQIHQDQNHAQGSESLASVVTASSFESDLQSVDETAASASTSAPSLSAEASSQEHTSGGVVVEVTRKRGCCMSFHADCKAILSAAKGVQIKRSSDFMADSGSGGGGAAGSRRNRNRPSLNRSKSMPAVQLSQVAAAANVEAANAAAAGNVSETASLPALGSPPGADENVMLALENVENLLKKDRMDANLLGMQSLFMLTTSDPDGDKDKTSQYASKMVLLRHDYEGIADAGASSILTLVETLVREWSLTTEDLFNESDSEGEEGEQDDDVMGEEGERAAAAAAVAANATSVRFDDYYATTMHNLALGVLSNILTHMASDPDTTWTDLAPQIQMWIQNVTLPLFLDEMRLVANGATAQSDVEEVRGGRHSARPNDASLAVRGLISILTLAPDMVPLVVEMGAIDILLVLRQTGIAVHAILAGDCKKAMEMLGHKPNEVDDPMQPHEDDDRKPKARR